MQNAHALAFALSQASMVLRWYRRREEGWRRGLLIDVFAR